MHFFIRMFSILTFLLITTFAGINGQWKGMETGGYENMVKNRILEQNFYFYDGKGNLIVNASVPGNSPPIVIDFKKYYPTCSNNVYFAFLFTVDLEEASNSHSDICSEGLTICYDGQLVGAHMREDFNITNVDSGKELVYACNFANGNKSLSETRALNVAFKTYYELKNAKLQLNNGIVKPLENIPADDVWHFFEITASFFETKYYYLAPKDGTIVLQIGDQKSLFTRVADSEDNEIFPLTFDYNRRTYGKIKNFDLSKLDLNDGNEFRENAGLWMLYLDFKSDYRSWQTISTIHSRKKCDMLLEIRGNRIEKCRTFFEDIAIIEPMGTNYTVDYTMETGIVKTQLYGQEDAREIATRIQRSIMQANIMSSTDQFKSENSETMEDIIRELRTSENSTSETTAFKGEFKFDVKIPIPPAPAAHVNVKGSISVEKQKTKFEKHTETNQTDKIFRNTNRMFSDITRAQSMMEKMKSTTGAAQSMKQAEILNTKQSFSTRESADFHVNLPPDTKVIIKQLMFECDGNIIKLPFTYFTDGKEVLNFNGTTGPKYTRPVTPSWVNQTSGTDPAKENFKNFISIDQMSMKPIVNEKLENEKKDENIKESEKTNDELMDQIITQNEENGE